MNNFKESLKVPEIKICGKTESKFRIEMDAYRDYVGELLPGFISFMEGTNLALNMLEDEYIMSNLEFRARIKDAMSSLTASDLKPLDDIFGFEITTPNEADKELIMLLMNKLLDKNICSRYKSHNKSNGYQAYHRVGIVQKDHSDSDFDNIEQEILESKILTLKRKYRDLTRKEQHEIATGELYQEVYLYPELRKLIRTNNLSSSTLNTIKNAREAIYARLTDDEVPPIEIQFKTKGVAEESKFGTASHYTYKPVDRQQVIDDFRTQKLIRGIHYPFKFQRNNNKMELQSSNQTLFEMFPFLKDAIIEQKRKNSTRMPSYNMHFATIFQGLKPYVMELAKSEPYYHTTEINPELIWNLIKLKITNPDYSIPQLNLTSIKGGR